MTKTATKTRTKKNKGTPRKRKPPRPVLHRGDVLSAMHHEISTMFNEYNALVEFRSAVGRVLATEKYEGLGEAINGELGVPEPVE